MAVNQVAEESEQYAAYTEPVKGHTIVGVYDITLNQELEEGQSVELVFPIDKAYEDKKIIVLHYTEKDGKAFMETYDPDVKDGQAVIETTGFSPYVVALNDPPAEEPDSNQPNTNSPAKEPDNSQSNPPAEEPDNSQPGPPVNNGGTGARNADLPVTDTNQPNSPSDDQNQSVNMTQNNQNQSGNLTQNNGQNSQTTDSGKDSQTASATPSGDTKTTDTKTTDTKAKAAPKTGDESPIGLWIAMMLLAISGVGYWVYEKRKSVR